MPPSPENNYQVGPTETFSRALWNAVFASLAARLAAREALEADFEALISGGTQAALDLISQNVAPQLESLLAFVTELEEQVEEVIGSGNAPNALKLGGNLPEFYLALGNATGTLAYNKVAGIDAAIAAAVAGLVNAAPGALDTLGELAAALGNDPNVVTNILAALGNRVRVDAAQALTGPQIVQALDNLGFSTIGKLLKEAASQSAARAAIGVTVHDFVQGLTLSNNAGDLVNDIDIAPGAAQAGNVYVANAAAMTKRLDANWAAGNNAGGLDTGVKAINSTYHAHALRKDSDGSFDWGYSLSATAPTVPAGYTKGQRLGAVMTDGAGAIRAFKQTGNRFFLKTYVTDLINSTARAAAPITLTIPSGVRSRVILALYLSSRANGDSSVSGYIYDGEDITILTSYNRVVGSGLPANMWMTEGFSNTSRQIGLALIHDFGPVGGGHALHTLGWEDYQIPRIGA